MRIGVIEAVVGGWLGADPPLSLLREGSAMLRAVLQDVLQVPDVWVDTPCGTNWLTAPELAQQFSTASRLQIERLIGQGDDWLEQQAPTWDAAFIIAPESDGLLQRLVSMVREANVPLVLNADESAIEICTSKSSTARWLAGRGISAIETHAVDWDWDAATVVTLLGEHGVVLKPDDGAGSWLVQRVRTLAEWQQAQAEFASAGLLERSVWQRYVAGRALSVASVRRPDGSTWPAPVAEQRLGGPSGFEYLGGSVPARIAPAIEARVREVAQQALEAVPGLTGFAGVDLILPDSADSEAGPIVVEINPRLTTSYAGWRGLLTESVWPWLLGLDHARPERTIGRSVEFAADGSATVRDL